MLNVLKTLRKIGKWIRKPFKFLISGLVANLVNYIFYMLLVYLKLGIFIPAIFGYSAGLFASFFLNRTWVFREEVAISFVFSTSTQTTFFLFVHALSAIIMGGLTSLLFKFVGLSASSSFVIAAVPIAFLNYVALNFLVFKKKQFTSQVS